MELYLDQLLVKWLKLIKLDLNLVLFTVKTKKNLFI